MTPEESELDLLNRFRGEIIDAFAAMFLEIQAMIATINEVDPYGGTRLTAKRALVLETRDSLRAHFEQLISPLRKPQ